MWVSRVFLRWYKSFNIRYHGYVTASTTPRPWEYHSNEFFPYVEIPLERRISTIVGANESGKSHLLSAIEKGFRGWSTTDNGKEEYDVQHICRYCALDGLEENAWPNIGIEISFASKAEYETCLGKVGVTPAAHVIRDADRVLRVFIDGSRSADNFAELFDHADKSIGHVAKSTWITMCEGNLPKVHFINSRLALSNEVHIQQLLDMYDGKKPSPAYDPLILQDLAATFLNINLQHDKAP
jgi:hypothetical protein